MTLRAMMPTRLKDWMLDRTILIWQIGVKFCKLGATKSCERYYCHQHIANNNAANGKAAWGPWIERCDFDLCI
jgi:hypothetical protein